MAKGTGDAFFRRVLHQGASIGAQEVTVGVIEGDEDPGGYLEGRDKDLPEICVVDGLVVGSEESEAERKVGGNQGVAIQIVGDRAD
ncbi:hypothetical protein PEBR_19840 [Penicillium brasilianum]|uniref:Uncharacterized protein n=1 Tax=Penicillium brasilianum TaxID=104259 RepID=A0A1S9RMV2_PENBI|nr:hypothetical protein PEBR_19840 [Penicillium brasilianum]